jgi:abortive infection bacteriophage resistance protein
MADKSTDNKVNIGLKIPLTFEGQVKILKERGLIIENEEYAVSVLSHINYHRLSAYLLPFRTDEKNYKPPTSFNQIVRIYDFDFRLRNIIMSVIEPIEISLRTQIAYYHAHKYAADGYKNSDNFEDPIRHSEFLQEFQETIHQNNKLLFIKHHIDYDSGNFPIWVASELFPFGMLSKFFANMKPEDRKYIATEIYHTGPDHLKSWLICITALQNRCAQYMRLYSHILVTHPKMPNNDPIKRSMRIFDILYIMKFLYSDARNWNNDFLLTLEALVEEFNDDINIEYIGFPENWKILLEL